MSKSHGHTSGAKPSLTYRIWSGMLTRVRNFNHKSSRRYQALGIDCDPRWADFPTFLTDMGECPEGMSLDRKDNSKGYWPSNCRWASRPMQSRNTCRNIWVTVNGERMVIKDALHMLGYTEQGYHYLKRNHGLDAQKVIDRYAERPKIFGVNSHGSPINADPT